MIRSQSFAKGEGIAHLPKSLLFPCEPMRLNQGGKATGYRNSGGITEHDVHQKGRDPRISLLNKNRAMH